MRALGILALFLTAAILAGGPIAQADTWEETVTKARGQIPRKRCRGW
jgi:hypothetical protein